MPPECVGISLFHPLRELKKDLEKRSKTMTRFAAMAGTF